MATSNPTYEAVVADLAFEPANVTVPSRTERKIAHEKWLHQALARVAAGEPAPKPPVKRARKKAS